MKQLFLLLPLLLLIVDPIFSKKYDKHDQYYDYPPRHNYYEAPEKYRRYDNQVASPQYQKTHTFISDYGPTPPPHDQVAKMARYIVHFADWAALATISSAPATKTFPFGSIVSISDGTPKNSSGVPYIYVSPLEPTTHDMEIDPRISLTISLAETDYCKQENFDPEDPRCAKVILTGKFKRVKTHSTEIEYAQNALFSRHPAMRSWPKSHGFYFAKIQIEQIMVQDYYGGPSIVPKAEYFNPDDHRVEA